MEHIIETKVCKQCQIDFSITDKDLEFYEKVSPIFDGEKQPIPAPTLCPRCRAQRRLTFRNERNLYKRKCDATGEDIISIYSPDSPYKIYNANFWWSDRWDPMSYGRDFDFSRPFFDQFKELLLDIPKASFMSSVQNEWCEFVNYSSWSKNCYLVFESDNNQNLFYSSNTFFSNNSLDTSYCERINNCYNCIYCKDSSSCISCINCINCEHCVWCNDIKNKKYCIENVQYTKEEYEEKLPKYLKKTQWGQLKYIGINKCNDGHNNESVSGNYIWESKNITTGFDIQNSKDCKYVSNLENSKDCYDVHGYGWEFGMSLIYEAHTAGNGCYKTSFTNCLFQECKESYYSDICNDVSYIFWCAGIRNKKYCILNKQYTKQEYEALVPKIIKHMKKTWEWWEFFPASLSPFGYNETLANEYFPLSESQARKKWFDWSTYEAPFPKVEKIIPADKLPNSIEDIPDDILAWAIECETTGKPFRIIKPELEFYRKHNLPIPKKHPNQRHLDRMNARNPREIYERSCDKCSKDIESTYSKEREETVYCEECYNKEI